MNSSLVPSGSLKSRRDRTAPRKRFKYQSAFVWICLKSNVRYACAPNHRPLTLLELIVSRVKTFSRDKRGGFVIVELKERRFSKFGFD